MICDLQKESGGKLSEQEIAGRNSKDQLSRAGGGSANLIVTREKRKNSFRWSGQLHNSIRLNVLYKWSVVSALHASARSLCWWAWTSFFILKVASM
jgi:hypothetical protein